MRWILSLSILAVAACNGGGDNGDTDTTDSGTTCTEQIDCVLELTSDITAGEGVYTSNCVACHGTYGTGGVGSDLTSTVPSLDTRGIAEVVISGQGAMAGFGSTLSDQEIADVVGYVEDSFGS